MRLEKQYKVFIVTGLSGAGRSSALKIFEDMGFEAIDNLPTYLLSNIINTKIKRNLAVGIDRQFATFPRAGHVTSDDFCRSSRTVAGGDVLCHPRAGANPSCDGSSVTRRRHHRGPFASRRGFGTRPVFANRARASSAFF